MIVKLKRKYNLYKVDGTVTKRIAQGLDEQAMLDFFITNKHNHLYMEEILTDDVIPLVFRDYSIIDGVKKLTNQYFVDDSFLKEIGFTLQELGNNFL